MSPELIVPLSKVKVIVVLGEEYADVAILPKIVKSKAKGQREFIEAGGLVPEKNEELRKAQIRSILEER